VVGWARCSSRHDTIDGASNQLQMRGRKSIRNRLAALEGDGFEPSVPVRNLAQTRSNGDVQHPCAASCMDRVCDRRLGAGRRRRVQGGPRRLEMGAVITAEGKVILNHDLEMGMTGIYVHVDLLPRMREWLDRLSAH